MKDNKNIEGSEKYHLAIIILNYNNYNLTIKTVQDLISKGIMHPIIVVDNLSPNESYIELNKAFGDIDIIDVIKSNKNGGYSYGNNCGVKYAENKYPYLKYICIMNPDVSVETTVLDNLTILLEKNSEIALASGVQILDGREYFGWDLPGYKDVILNNIPILNKLRMLKMNKYFTQYHSNKSNEILQIDVLSGCFFIIKLEVFKEVNYFDEKVFLYYEENILSYKIKKKGLKSVVSLKDSFYHNHQHKSKKLKVIQKDYSIFLESQRYYCKNILNIKSTKLLWILGLFNKHVIISLKNLAKYIN